MVTTGWVKSLQCKSRVLDDVVTRYGNSKNHHYHNLVPDSTSCRKSVQGLKDVIETNKRSKPRKPKTPEPPRKAAKRGGSIKNESVSDLGNDRKLTNHYTRRSGSIESLLPALTELQEGHPSRNVVEIIFHTSWSPKSFSGRIEMVFKVQNLSRTLIRFEEYREIVKARASSGDGASVDDSRCVADGNEVMRFYCLGPTNGFACHASGGAWAFYGGKGVSLCTYSGSGSAHEKAGGGYGRRAMLVCRVISGRVCKEMGGSLVEGRVGFDSVSRENDELLVFDSRAVLPCFLIIYKL
ncbi:C2H2 zinc finger transcription factor [Lithospermum erythrorhizon]|uniref:C2H2 zinc finger transcription factor n=1 Tax=Lithospermum erythrorhizon TaxID=34254 RepID=A0AAV3NJU3_LITER